MKVSDGIVGCVLMNFNMKRSPMYLFTESEASLVWFGLLVLNGPFSTNRLHRATKG